MPEVGIVGMGSIGTELYSSVCERRWNVRFVANSKALYDVSKKEKICDIGEYRSQLGGLDLMFLAIPTFDDGQMAFGYIKSALAENVPVVSCEKGALGNYFGELEAEVNQGRIGYNASVGGETRLLDWARRRMNPKVREIHAVLNGTLNYIFDGLANGRSLGELVSEARRLGYTEPGAEDPLDIINKEAIGDVSMKASILFNSCNLVRDRMRAKNVDARAIDFNGLGRLVRDASNRRYVVSITKESNDEDLVGGFGYSIDDWKISASFKRVDSNPLFRRLIPSGVNNAILISEGRSGEDGSYVLSGPGAGAKPTVASMIIDAEKILKIKQSS